MTLVALLLTAVCGAWAQSSLNVVELEVPADWKTDDSNMTAADLPGFKAVTLEEGQAWTGAPAEGIVVLVYAFDGAEVKYINFEKGKYSGHVSQPLPKKVVFGAKFYYTTGPASASGPEVAWNKTSKTGTFDMPGGNVELEPEYYPQATMVAGAVTAVAGVKATTDDPLVTLDKTKLIGASGMMYYVGTTDTKPAYNAEGWTSEVPTAADITMAKTVYVWYYPVGADSDNPAKTYSDGEMNINALQVAVADPPTYAVTFAEGTPEADKWATNLPDGGVVKGTPVTVTYTGSKKVLGVKAEKKAAAVSLIVNPEVGQVIGSDGKNYDADALLPTGVAAVAVIAYVGCETGDDTYKNGLAIALADESGMMNWSTAMSTCGAKTAITGAKWCLPSKDQWKQMFKANGGKVGSYSGLNTTITTAGGTTLQEFANYWSSSEGSPGVSAYSVDLRYGSANWYDDSEDYNAYLVRACLAF